MMSWLHIDHSNHDIASYIVVVVANYLIHKRRAIDIDWYIKTADKQETIVIIDFLGLRSL